MKRREEEVDQSVERHLKLFNAPRVQEIDDAKERTRRRLNMQPVGDAEREMEASPAEYGARRPAWRWRLGFAGVVAAVALAVVFMPKGIDARAVVEAADGGLYQASGRVLQAGEKIETGSVVRANGSGAMLKLADGSHVEMRGNSKLSLERADDGVRIQLSDGDVIVNASKQHGHLYVQTKDVNVSVVGTVFLVKSEETGSRVAVIEGEVRVQQGTKDKNLRPGEQVSTNPLAELQPVSQEIAWSSQAPEHIAMLQQSAVVPVPAREAFDVASIRPSGSPTGGGGRGGGEQPCAGSSVKIDPHQFSITKATLYNLITLAYGLGGAAGGAGTRCANASAMKILSGGPDWKSDQFDIQATIPEGSADYTSMTVGGVSVQEAGPRLQEMLQALLADRFKLSLRHEKKEMPVYVLGVAKGGPNLTAWKDGDPVSLGGYSYATPIRNSTVLASVLSGAKASMAQLAGRLEAVTSRPVLDRTNLVGDFNFRLEFAPPPDFTGYPSLYPGVQVMTSPSLIAALKEQLGLELKADKAPVEVLVIEHVEKPSEN